MKKISIREKLILYFVVLSIISITIISLFSIFEAKKGITDRTFSQLILLRDLRREQILTFFESRTKELKSLARSKEIMEMAELFMNKASSTDNRTSLLNNDHLLDFAADSSYFKSSYFISAEGDIYKYSPLGKSYNFLPETERVIPDTSFLSGYKTTKDKTSFSVFEQILPQKSVLTFIAVPVFCNDGDYCGELVSEILPEVIYNIIYDKFPGSGMGKTGEAYLVGSDGMMRSPSRFIQGAVLNIPVNTDGFSRAMAGTEGVGIYDDYRGVKILGAYGLLNIGGLNRVILAEIDSNEAMVPLSVIRSEILLLSLIIVLAIFAVAWVVAYGITRPLVRLKSAVNFIAEGNYNQQLEINANDEIGELTRAFNAMAVEINARKNMEAELAEERNKRIRAVFDGQDIERQRLSRELHDGLGQQLVAGKLILESSLYAEPDNLKAKILEAQGIFDQIIGDIRRISHDLSPSILQEFGLRSAMENLCNNMMKASGIRVDLLFDLEEKKPA
ncbi:MAG: HAMP domain-containing protein, partial [Bacteroidales bacterium]|nr:HAMP domain-containing protein [Bacteroidales bacterium]